MQGFLKPFAKTLNNARRRGIPIESHKRRAKVFNAYIECD